MNEEITTADRISEKIREETERFSRNATATELAAAKILHDCYRYKSTGEASHAFPLVPKQPARRGQLIGAPWIVGDLASGDAGSQFNYAYLPVRFVESLLKFAREEAQLAPIFAEALVSGATVYSLNSLREILDEAITNLLFEATMVIKEVKRNLDKEGNEPTAERFSQIINEITQEGNKRRNARVRKAWSEIDPKQHRADQIASLYQHYLITSPAWETALEFFRANKNRKAWMDRDWKAKIIDEVRELNEIDLPIDLVSLLSADDFKERRKGNISHLLHVPRKFQPTPDGFALEHAARLCGLPNFSLSTAHLGDLKRAQAREIRKTKVATS